MLMNLTVYRIDGLMKEEVIIKINPALVISLEPLLGGTRIVTVGKSYLSPLPLAVIEGHIEREHTRSLYDVKLN